MQVDNARIRDAQVKLFKEAGVRRTLSVCIVVAFALVGNVFAEGPDTVWTRIYGGPQADMANVIVNILPSERAFNNRRPRRAPLTILPFADLCTNAECRSCDRSFPVVQQASPKSGRWPFAVR